MTVAVLAKGRKIASDTNPATPGELRWKVKTAREKHPAQYSSDFAGKQTGIAGSTVRAYENGNRENIPREWVKLYADFIGISDVRWFYDGIASDPPFVNLPPVESKRPPDRNAQPEKRKVAQHLRLVPFWGPVPAGNWETPPEEPAWIQVSEALDGEEGIVAVRVTGNSMEPRLSHGQLVIIKQDSRPHDGVITLARNQDSELTLKVLRYVEGKGYELHSLNPDYGTVTAESWSIIGYAISIEETNLSGIRP
jgi:SOS-response transcriptional repressor LexA